MSAEGEWIATFDDDVSFNILRACRVSFVMASSREQEQCKSSCRSVSFGKIHFFSENIIISGVPKISRQCFGSLLI